MYESRTQCFRASHALWAAPSAVCILQILANGSLAQPSLFSARASPPLKPYATQAVIDGALRSILVVFARHPELPSS